MKNTSIKALLLCSVISIFGINKSQAQNLQLFYDAGRGCVTSTVEMFRPDAGGSTFFFVDFDYSPKASGAYWEIARELNFWQDSKVSWLSVQRRHIVQQFIPWRSDIFRSLKRLHQDLVNICNV